MVWTGPGLAAHMLLVGRGSSLGKKSGGGVEGGGECTTIVMPLELLDSRECVRDGVLDTEELLLPRSRSSAETDQREQMG